MNKEVMKNLRILVSLWNITSFYGKQEIKMQMGVRVRVEDTAVCSIFYTI